MLSRSGAKYVQAI